VTTATRTKTPRPIDLSKVPAVQNARRQLRDAEDRLQALRDELDRHAGALGATLDDEAADWLAGDDTQADTVAAEQRELRRRLKIGKRGVELAAAKLRQVEREAAHAALRDREAEYRAIAETVAQRAQTLLEAIDTELRWRETVLETLPGERGETFPLLLGLEARGGSLRFLLEQAAAGGYIDQRGASNG